MSETQTAGAPAREESLARARACGERLSETLERNERERAGRNAEATGKEAGNLAAAWHVGARTEPGEPELARTLESALSLAAENGAVSAAHMARADWIGMGMGEFEPEHRLRAARSIGADAMRESMRNAEKILSEVLTVSMEADVEKSARLREALGPAMRLAQEMGREAAAPLLEHVTKGETPDGEPGKEIP